MPKYQVTALEQIKYLIEVEASSAEEAEALATAQWNASTDPENEFDSQGYGIEITHIFDEDGNHA